MNTSRRHVRNGIGEVRPYIYGSIDLPGFIKQTFEAVELERNDFGPESFQVVMQIGDSVLVIEAGELPADVHPWKGAIYVYVKDVDIVYDRAIKLGAKPLAPVEDKPYQERQGGFLDAAGNTWWVSTFKNPQT